VLNGRSPFISGDKFQVFVAPQLIDGYERVTAKCWIVHHNSAPILTDKPAMFRIAQVRGGEFDLRRMPVESNTISSTYLFARHVFQRIRHIVTSSPFVSG
jgi:hypothetical protein